MKQVIVSLMLLTVTGLTALHMDLDPAKKIDFAQKRRDMQLKAISDKEADLSATEKALQALSKSGKDTAQLPLMTKVKQLKGEIGDLKAGLVITENSIKALTHQLKK